MISFLNIYLWKYPQIKRWVTFHISGFLKFFYLTLHLPGKLTEITFAFTAMLQGRGGRMNEPIGSLQLLPHHISILSVWNNTHYTDNVHTTRWLKRACVKGWRRQNKMNISFANASRRDRPKISKAINLMSYLWCVGNLTSWYTAFNYSPKSQSLPKIKKLFSR